MIDNLKNLYNYREEVFIFFRDSIKMLSDASYEAQQNETKQGGTGLKLLAPKQMLQRLSMALANVKAGNNSAKLLNGIRHLLFIPHIKQKKSLKKYTIT